MSETRAYTAVDALASPMSLPLAPELIREIIYFLLFSAPPHSSTPEGPGCSTKPSWLTLNALSLTSRTYRALTLEAWFRTLHIESPEDLEYVRCCWPEVGVKWTRHLHCVQPRNSSSLFLWDLSCLLHLSSIRVDYLSPILMRPIYPRLSPTSPGMPFFNFSSSVEHLDLRGLVWPNPQVLHNIPHTQGLEHLKTLKMKHQTSWCGLCNRSYKARCKDRLTRLVYEGYGLAIDYARVLTPLEYLEEVVIIVPNSGFRSTTLGHTPTTPDPDPETNLNLNLWAGECDTCIKSRYEDDAFRRKWVDRKRGVGVCRDDDGKKDTRPPKLRRVEWRFCDGF